MVVIVGPAIMDQIDVFNKWEMTPRTSSILDTCLSAQSRKIVSYASIQNEFWVKFNSNLGMRYKNSSIIFIQGGP